MGSQTVFGRAAQPIPNEEVKQFGLQTVFGRAAQPAELALKKTAELRSEETLVAREKTAPQTESCSFGAEVLQPDYRTLTSPEGSAASSLMNKRAP